MNENSVDPDQLGSVPIKPADLHTPTKEDMK